MRREPLCVWGILNASTVLFYRGRYMDTMTLFDSIEIYASEVEEIHT